MNLPFLRAMGCIKTKGVAISVIMAMVALMPVSTYAIPSYAKNLEVDCMHCHTVLPELNAQGETFKKDLGDALEQKEYSVVKLSTHPASAFIKMRFMDKRISKDRNDHKNLTNDRTLHMRSLHELEIFLSGRSDNVFYSIEIEAEDETLGFNADGDPTGFSPTLAAGWVALDILPELKIFGGYGSPYALDAKNTVHHHSILRRQWMAANLMPDGVQFVGVGGNVGETTSYSVAWHGEGAPSAGAGPNAIVEMESNDPRSYTGRVVSTFMDQAVGVFGTYGHTFGPVRAPIPGDPGAERSENWYNNYGVDLSLRFDEGKYNLKAVHGVMIAEGGHGDRVTSIEGNARLFEKFIPVVGVDSYTTGGGLDLVSPYAWVTGQAALMYDYRTNIRIGVGVEGTLDRPPLADGSKGPRETRWVATADIGI